ncbi:MAG: hypothetical protein Q7U10_00060 [Thermodesulfovibrionia bacterium]|nr:hypothetical protein [Thermodesulfovibrionia bacterium]
MRRNLMFIVILLFPFMLVSCATYKPVSLSNLQPDFAPYSETINGVTLSMKKLSAGDSKTYFDRDVIAEGYQPLHITISNNSNKYILFSNQGISLPIVPAQEVAEKVHTSTVGRATAYGVGALLFWPLLIPAVVDGVGSANANEKLDRDFNAKSADQMVVQPYATHNGIIFVPTSDYNGTFTVRLIDKETKEKLEYRVNGL